MFQILLESYGTACCVVAHGFHALVHTEVNEVCAPIACHVEGVVLLECEELHVGVDTDEVLVRVEVRVPGVQRDGCHEGVSSEASAMHEDVLLSVAVEVLEIDLCDRSTVHEAADAIFAGAADADGLSTLVDLGVDHVEVEGSVVLPGEHEVIGTITIHVTPVHLQIVVEAGVGGAVVTFIPAQDSVTESASGGSYVCGVGFEAIATNVEREGDLHAVTEHPLFVLGEDDVGVAVTVHVSCVDLRGAGEPSELDRKGHLDRCLAEGQHTHVGVEAAVVDVDVEVLADPVLVPDFDHVLDVVTVEIREASLLGIACAFWERHPFWGGELKGFAVASSRAAATASQGDHQGGHQDREGSVHQKSPSVLGRSTKKDRS